MALFVIIVSIIILRRIISLVSIIIFNIIPGIFVMALSGDYVGLTFGRGLSGGYKMRLAGRGIVDPVYAAISQRCFHTFHCLSFPFLLGCRLEKGHIVPILCSHS